MTSSLPWPEPLRPGDRVQLAAASSALLGDDALARLEAGIAVLEDWGLEVEHAPLHGRHWGYLAGRDGERRGDLTPGRSGPEGNAPALVACVRGGWGAARLLEEPLALPCRWLLGFSDVTSLLWAQLAQGQGGAIHGPLLTTLAAEPAWSQERLRALLFGEPLADLHGESWGGGCAEGPLLAANLTVATHLLGTPHLPELRGAILVLEDVGEAPYRIERMLTHWRLCGALQQLAGIGLGQFSDCDDADRDERDRDEVEGDWGEACESDRTDETVAGGGPAKQPKSICETPRETPNDTEPAAAPTHPATTTGGHGCETARETPRETACETTLKTALATASGSRAPSPGRHRQSSQTRQQRFSLEQVLRERTADLGIPVVSNLPVGHVAGNAALPLGAWARLDGPQGRLQIRER